MTIDKIMGNFDVLLKSIEEYKFNRIIEALEMMDKAGFSLSTAIEKLRIISAIQNKVKKLEENEHDSI